MNRKALPVLWIGIAMALLAMGTGCKQDRPADPEQWEGLPCSTGEFACLEPTEYDDSPYRILIGNIMECDQETRRFQKNGCLPTLSAAIQCADHICLQEMGCRPVKWPDGTPCEPDAFPGWPPPPGVCYRGSCTRAPDDDLEEEVAPEEEPDEQPTEEPESE